MGEDPFDSCWDRPIARVPIAEWAFVAFPDGEVDGPCRTGHERDHGGLLPLPRMRNGSVSTLHPEVFGVGCARLADSQAVEPEQCGQRAWARSNRSAVDRKVPLAPVTT